MGLNWRGNTEAKIPMLALKYILSFNNFLINKVFKIIVLNIFLILNFRMKRFSDNPLSSNKLKIFSSKNSCLLRCFSAFKVFTNSYQTNLNLYRIFSYVNNVHQIYIFVFKCGVWCSDATLFDLRVDH